MPPRRKSTGTARARTSRAPKSKLEFGSRHYRCKATVGELALVGPDGQVWEWAACGVHRSGGVHETATNDEDTKAKGFQADCDDCQAQAQTTALYANAHATV
jgi:hypothetical protein